MGFHQRCSGDFFRSSSWNSIKKFISPEEFVAEAVDKFLKELLERNIAFTKNVTNTKYGPGIEPTIT